MTDDKLNITIRIAGQNPIALRINRADEERVRNAEYQVNRLWSSWTQRFPEKNAMEVMAMVAYRFAELFFTASKTAEETNAMLGHFEEDLDRMLHSFGVGQQQQPEEKAAEAGSRPQGEGSSPWVVG